MDNMTQSRELFLPSQKMLFADFWTNYTDTMIVARRRLGKSYFAVMTALLAMYHAVGLLPKLYPGMFPNPKLDAQLRMMKEKNQGRGITYRTMYFLPFEVQSKTLFDDAFRAASRNLYHNLPLLKKYPVKMTKTEGVLEFGPNRAQVGHKGIGKDAEHQRGIGVELAIIDEIQQHSQFSLESVIYPTLTDNAGRILATGTANASSVLNDLRHEYEADANKRLWIIDAMQSIEYGDITYEQLKTEVVDKRYRGNWNHPTFLREYMCRFTVPISGAILEDWKPEIAERGMDDKIVISMDIGFNDYYVVLFWAVTPDRRLILLDGLRHRQKTTADMIELTRQRLRERGHGMPSLVVYPHDATQKHTSAFKSDKVQWMDSKIAPEYRRAWKYPRKNQEIYALLAVTPNIFRSANVPEDILVDLRNWKYDKEGKQPDIPLHDRHSHTGDAFSGGALAIESAMNMIVPPKPKVKVVSEIKSDLELTMGTKRYAKFKKNLEKQEREHADKAMRTTETAPPQVVLPSAMPPRVELPSALP